MKQKILIAAGLYPPDIGGPATYVSMIEKKLPAHGFVLEVVPFHTVRHLPKILRHCAYFLTLYKSAKACDALYALDGVSVGLPARFVALLRNKKLFVRLGGDYAWEQGRQRFGLQATLDEYTHNRSVANIYTHMLARVQDFVVRGAETVIVPSEYLKSIVATWPKIDPSRISVIYSALTPLPDTGSRKSARTEIGCSDSDVVVVSSARLVPWKGFALLVQTVVSLHEQYPDISLYIVGDGPERDRLEKLVEEHDAGDYIFLTGATSKDRLGMMLRAADVFVLNTGYEGLSHQLLEVMDIGVPIVTTDVGGNPELVRHEVSGLLVPYNTEDALRSAIEQVMTKESIRTQYVQNARIRARDFDAGKVTEQLASVLHKTI